MEQEVLLWCDPQGKTYSTPEEVIQTMQAELEAERQRAERLAEYVRSLGVDPDNLPEL
ncbi:MAG: hypothetical protein MJA27_03070 [Pseudanabaenales cyanobacterium]|nr:hypothetical protein [Pseudanabaenales cyanobacterium]